MVLSDQLDRELMRARAALVAMIVAFAFLGAVLWRVQILGATEYMSSLDRQSMRRVRLPAVRGRIFDRNGICLADDRPGYCIAIYIEELRQPGKWKNTVNEVEKVINQLADTLGVEKQVARNDIRRHISRRLALPFLAWRDVDHATLARWAESSVEFPGVDVYVEPVRAYPQGPLAAHVLGHVGRADARQDPNEPYHFYLPGMEGKRGTEAVMNETLAGVPGGRLIRVDASGFKHEEEEGERRDPSSGEDIVLTIDSRIQGLAEQAISGETGAVVILDPRNGDVLAMASSPSFDSNSFTPSVSRVEWDRLISDEGKPLFNRAVSGMYPPGSTFKPLVAIAALESGRVTEDTRFSCSGCFDFGNLRFRCWRKSGHGLLGMRKALAQSCNAYFCQLGLKCGYDRIRHMAEAVGFGQETRIELMGEAAGFLQEKAWPADTCNISIGQGALTVTPIQMAVLAAAIANGGYVYRPRLILQSSGLKSRESEVRTRRVQKGELVTKMAWSAKTVRVLREAMYDVVQASSGTGKRARIPKVEMAGKTGTAEYGPKADAKKHAWMIVFAPFDQPRYAVAVVIENAVSGGVTAAPRINELMEGIFELEDGTHPVWDVRDTPLEEGISLVVSLLGGGNPPLSFPSWEGIGVGPIGGES